MAIATTIPSRGVIVANAILLDGIKLFSTYIPQDDYAAYADLPLVVEYEGTVYGKSGWNSDTGEVVYRSDVRLGTEASERIAALEAALAPFAHFARQWNRNPIRRLHDTLYSIHVGEEGAEFRLSDCQRALALLEGK